MSNNDWQRIGNDLWDVVQDAVDSGNFQQLNRQVKEKIGETVGDAADNIRGSVQDSFSRRSRNPASSNGGFRSGFQGLGEEWRKAWADAERPADRRYQKSKTPGYQAGTRRKAEETKQLPAVYVSNPPGQFSGAVMALTGYTLSGAFGISSIAVLLATVFDPSPAGLVGMGVLAAMSAASLGLGVVGSRARKLALRFKNYVRQIGNRGYCTVEELSSQNGRSHGDVVRDLKKMIEKRMFLQGHLDQQETCVIVTNEMYQQYLTVQEHARERQQKQEEQESQRAKLPEECQKILDEGQEYIRYIQKCNDDIPGEEISQKLSRLELIITRIFNEVSKNPSLAGELRKFMSYYLPTTRKLVDAYREMDQEPIASENIIKTKREIEDTLDTINQAFENLLNSFFEERALDISSDISVLHTMLAQEGLTGGDFDTSKDQKKQRSL